MKTPAFTLIELIMVLGAIGLLTSVVLLDFGSARQRQSVQVVGDQTLALMQQSQAQVRSGAIGESGLMCRGAYFDEGALPQRASAPFDTEEGVCDLSAGEAELYGLSIPDVSVSAMEVGEVVLSSDLWALFAPPDGELRLVNADGSYANDGEITIQHERDEDLGFLLYLSRQGGQMSLLGL